MRKSMLQNRWTWIILLVVQVIFAAVLFVGYLQGSPVPHGNTSVVARGFLCILVSTFFYMSILRGDCTKQESQLFLLLLAVNSLYLFSDASWNFVQDVPSLRAINILVNVVYLICPLVMTLVYWYFLDIWAGVSERHHAWIITAIKLIAGAQILLILLSPVTGWYFQILPDGSYIRGNLYVATIIVPSILAVLCVGRISYYRMPLIEQAVLLAYLLIPILAALVQGIFPEVPILSVATFVSIALLYTNYYVRKEADIASLRRDLVESELRSLQLQVNPHFLYNTLHSAASLCETDPHMAQEMIYRLSSYMRDNFADIERPLLVTFSEELTLIDHYLDIELMRFPNIKVTKDIEVFNFLIPAATLQPLVENSIKHGIGKRRKSAGTIKISSSQTNDAWIVRVSDNGVGCDAKNMLEPQDGHFGLENVRKRLKMLCDGELEMSSTPGQGTTVQIVIPKSAGGGYSQITF